MNLAPHFSRSEFERSNTAARHGIDNRIPDELLDNARQTAAMLERIRTLLGQMAGKPVPMTVTSGYRALRVNRIIGSSDGSAHTRAHAADWVAPAFGTPTAICRALVPHVDSLGIGQLIDEYPDTGSGWIHVGVPLPTKPDSRIITITRRGTFRGIVHA